MTNFKLPITTTLLVLFGLSICAFKPSVLVFSPHASAIQKSDTIPFELTKYNNLAVKCILNDQDTVTLMLHTAANDLALTKAATAHLSSLSFNGADTVTSWGGRSDARYSTGNSLRIGQQKWDSLAIWEDEHSGQLTDGKFGMDLFQDQVLEINFDHSFLVLHPTLPDITHYQAIDLEMNRGLMFLEGTMQLEGIELRNKFLIHSGYGGSILLDDAFAAENGLDGKLPILKESILKDSYGNELKTLKAVMPVFQVGGTAFENMPVGFFAGAIGRQKMSVIGGDLLKRFNLIFDFKDKKLYVQPNAGLNGDFKD